MAATLVESWAMVVPLADFAYWAMAGILEVL